MLRSWPLSEQIAFFEKDVGIPLVEESETGKLFPASHRARDVRDGLLALCRRRGVRFVPDAFVTGLAAAHGRWIVHRDGAASLEADAVVVATGGLSVPKSGSDGTGLAILERLGHTLHPTYPALTPLEGAPPELRALAGVSLPVGDRGRGRRPVAPRPTADFSSRTAATAGPPSSTSRTSPCARSPKACRRGSSCGGRRTARRTGRRRCARRARAPSRGRCAGGCPRGWRRRSRSSRASSRRGRSRACAARNAGVSSRRSSAPSSPGRGTAATRRPR